MGAFPRGIKSILFVPRYKDHRLFIYEKKMSAIFKKNKTSALEGINTLVERWLQSFRQNEIVASM